MYLENIVVNKRFYIEANEWANDERAIAHMITGMVLDDKIGRNPADSAEQPGFDFLSTIYSSPDQHPEVVSELVDVVVMRTELGLLPRIIAQYDKLSALTCKVVRASAIQDRIGALLSVEKFFELHSALVQVLGKDLPEAAKRAIEDAKFAADLDSRTIDISEADVHCTFASAGALTREGYRSHLFKSLKSVDASEWEQEIKTPDKLYSLLVKAVETGFAELRNVEAALQNVGVGLASRDSPGLTWTQAPEGWSVVYESLNDAKRRSAANVVVDNLQNHSIAQIPALDTIFGDDLQTAFTNNSRKDLIRQIATPILNESNSTLLRWLLSIAKRSTSNWDDADSADRDAFRSTLQERIASSAEGEERGLLIQLADALNINYTLPQEEAKVGDSDEEEIDQPEK